jgi:LCP family protein required for cell wall assembly
VVAVLAVLLGVDAALLDRRIDRFDVDLHHGVGTTWLVVGLDSRAELPTGATAEQFGTTDDVPGSRADVVLVLHETADGMRMLSVPRDVVVRTRSAASRLALTWLDGPQATVDALCRLGIPTDHVVAVDLAGFASVVDAVGGLDVDVPAPVRDTYTGLRVDQAGSHHLDGIAALAMVRSRHPEERVDGQWVPAPVNPDGRATAAGTVLSALMDASHRGAVRPWTLQHLAWSGTGAVSVDAGTSIADLARLAGTDIGPVEVLPVSAPKGDLIPRFPTDRTAQALADAGLSCER